MGAPDWRLAQHDLPLKSAQRANRESTLTSQAATLQIEENKRDGRLFLALRGELDIATAPILENALALARASRSPVLVDLSHLRFVDAHGLRAVLGGHHQAAREGTGLTVVMGDGQVARLFTVAGVTHVLDVLDRPRQPATS